MSLEIRTSVTGEELRRWRRDLKKDQVRVVAQGYSKNSAPAGQQTEDGSGAVFTKATPPPKLDPGEVFRRVLEYQLKFAMKSREEYLQLVRVLRATTPSMQHLTDEEAADQLEAAARRKVEESVKRVFRKQGREHELRYNLDGY